MNVSTRLNSETTEVRTQVVGEFVIREVRAYATKQRPNPTTIHGPYPTREQAMETMRIKASNASRNDNRSNWYVEEA